MYVFAPPGADSRAHAPLLGTMSFPHQYAEVSRTCLTSIAEPMRFVCGNFEQSLY